MKIAIIDDNSTITLTIEAVLKQDGTIMVWDNFDRFQEPHSFYSKISAEGIDYYDAIILDNDLGAGLPKGIEIARDLKSKGYYKPIAILTGDPTSSTAINVSNESNVEYIQKKFTVNDTSNAYKRLATFIGMAR